MKCLSDYTEEKITNLLNKYNGFFAFSQKQFNEAKKEGLKYVDRGAGLIHEAGRSKEFDKEYDLIIKDAIKLDIKENGKEAIIERELCNHECYYTGDITNAVDKLEDYNITHNEILTEFRKNQSKHYDD